VDYGDVVGDEVLSCGFSERVVLIDKLRVVVGVIVRVEAEPLAPANFNKYLVAFGNVVSRADKGGVISILRDGDGRNSFGGCLCSGVYCNAEEEHCEGTALPCTFRREERCC